MLKIQVWRPDTHPGHVVEEEWEYDQGTGRDTGREHRCVSYRYPDGTTIHRDTHGAAVAQDHYKKLLRENRIKNEAYKVITDLFPARMKKSVLDSDGDAILDASGQPRLTVKAKHRPRFNHLGNGRYEVIVPGIDEVAYRDLAAKLADLFGDMVLMLKPASWDRTQ